MEEQKPFKFKAFPKEILFVDSWQYGVHGGLFSLSLGIKNDPMNNEGEILGSYVMTPDSAKIFYRDLGKLLNPQPPNEPPKRNLPS